MKHEYEPKTPRALDWKRYVNNYKSTPIDRLYLSPNNRKYYCMLGLLSYKTVVRVFYERKKKYRSHAVALR